ncbi:unnamed protein product [Urochloa decumbens]|uniref:[RNA-polymerase]-subunit kinase n=1 Tax=Urochloa decumbens TaxID=240449 RepID=A0ABC8Y1X5_9POAL
MEERPATCASCLQNDMVDDANAGVAVATRKRRRRVPVAVGSAEDYEETCLLGEGGFGTVVKARHLATGLTVAIKRLTPPDADSQTAAASISRLAGAGSCGLEEELLREARFHEACGGSGHPFIVGFRGLVRDPTAAAADLGLVMECVDGPSLHDYLRQRRRRRHGGARIPEATARAAMWQLLTAAKTMHESGVVHRDIKPGNILVGDGRRVLKICDFGLAMATSEAPSHGPAGTLWYKAPEVLLDMRDYDARVDAWSLGCVMAEIIYGRALFAGSYEREQLVAIFDVLGVPDGGAWPEFASTAFAAEAVTELDVRRGSRLRELFPAAMLSREGFQVLHGLLTCNPHKRLTADAALKLPWFAKVEALQLPSEDDVASAFANKELHIVPSASEKRKLHFS